MRKKSIFWGLVLICAAVLIIIDAFGQGMGWLNNIPVLKIVLGVLCLSWAVGELWKKRVPNIFFPLSFIFLIFESNIAAAVGMASDNIMSNWLVLLCALLLTVGTSIIFPNSFSHISKISKVCTGSGNGHDYSGSSVKYIDCSTFASCDINNELGSREVFFENTELYTGNGTLNVNNRLGSLEIHVPKDWHINCDVNNSLGSVEMSSSGKQGGLILNIIGTNRLGSIEIY